MNIRSLDFVVAQDPVCSVLKFKGGFVAVLGFGRVIRRSSFEAVESGRDVEVAEWSVEVALSFNELGLGCSIAGDNFY